MAFGADRRRARLGRRRRLSAAHRADRPRPVAPRPRGRTCLHRRRRDLRAPSAGPLPDGLRLPRALPRLCDRRRCLPVRSGGLLRAAQALVATTQERTGWPQIFRPLSRRPMPKLGFVDFWPTRLTSRLLSVVRSTPRQPGRGMGRQGAHGVGGRRRARVNPWPGALGNR